ncbi:MAG: hypothetical protein QM286_09660 [Acidobacteriota bacterium]|nr:hypothetical protein [Acidobacteriota bacterium]NLH70923.1 hypothetical protein [Brooklawnia sp.]
MKQKTTASAPTEGRDQGMAILSYLLAGIGLYGGLGWLGDRFWQTSFLLPVGMILGMGISIYVVIKRYGSAA